MFVICGVGFVFAMLLGCEMKMFGGFTALDLDCAEKIKRTDLDRCDLNFRMSNLWSSFELVGIVNIKVFHVVE